MNKEYQIISVDASLHENNEGLRPNLEEAEEFAQALAEAYGKTHEQDLEDRDKVLYITIRPVWRLDMHEGA